MEKFDLRNMTKVEIYRNHLGQLFVDTPPSQVGGSNEYLRLEAFTVMGNLPVVLSAEENTPVSGEKQ